MKKFNINELTSAPLSSNLSGSKERHLTRRVAKVLALLVLIKLAD